MGNCKGPCEGLQTAEDYKENLAQLKNLLRGNLAPVIRHFKGEMKNQAAELSFEKAEMVKKKLDFLINDQSRSVVANTKTGDMDVFSILKEKDTAFVNYLMIRNGAIIQTQTNKVETHLDESTEEILSFSVAQLRTTFNSDATEIIVPFNIDYPQADVM